MLFLLPGKLLDLLDFLRVERGPVGAEDIVLPMLRFRQVFGAVELKIAFAVDQSEVDCADVCFFQNRGYVEEVVGRTRDIFRAKDGAAETACHLDHLLDRFGIQVAMEAHDVAVFSDEATDREIGARMHGQVENRGGKRLGRIDFAAPLPDSSQQRQAPIP